MSLPGKVGERLRKALEEELPACPLLYEKNCYEGGPAHYSLTYKGLSFVCEYYKKHYGIDIALFQNEGSETSISAIRGLFAKYAEAATSGAGGLLEFTRAVLVYSPSHTVPLVITKAADRPAMVIIFDSIASVRDSELQYKELAKDFPEFNFFLNKGARQVDGYSCSSDAVAVLKDALKIPDLERVILERVELLKSYETKARGSSLSRSRTGHDLAKAVEDVENFKMFIMPEELSKTAQRPGFLVYSDMGKKLSTTKEFSKSLAEKIAESKSDDGDNLYLFLKGYKLAEIAISMLREQNAASSISSAFAHSLVGIEREARK